jgi:hypothetical protein
VRSKPSAAPRKVWRMTPENTLGEILELAPTGVDYARKDLALTLTPARAPSWRASSYDLLHGLVVRDVTDTIPGAIFASLFNPDSAGMPASRRKRS